MTNLPSASSCPSTSNRNLFRGFGVEPRSRVLLKDRSLLLTIWLIFWNRLDSCRWKQNRNNRVSEKKKNLCNGRLSFNMQQRGSYPERFPDWYQHSVMAENTKTVQWAQCKGSCYFNNRHNNLPWTCRTHLERGVMIPGDMRGLFRGEIYTLLLPGTRRGELGNL